MELTIYSYAVRGVGCGVLTASILTIKPGISGKELG
jgi:hypothetical protein